MTDDLETVWNGTQGWGGGDRYLCIALVEKPPVLRVYHTPQPEQGTFGEPVTYYKNRAKEWRIVMQTLAARPSWKTKELGDACGLPRSVMHMILCREHRKGTVARPSYGVVALVTRQVA